MSVNAVASSGAANAVVIIPEATALRIERDRVHDFALNESLQMV